jgi:hypothetical protein
LYLLSSTKWFAVTTTIDLNDVENWPADLLRCLEANHATLDGWETGQNRPGGRAYDRAINALNDTLQAYALVGWHCTRLTPEEISDIRALGLSLPDQFVLAKRIDRVVAQGHVGADIAKSLKAENQAHEPTRAGRLWFCFFPPALGGETGINRFFRYWGGEALYNSHQDDPLSAKALQSIGAPCIIEADVPIRLLGGNPGLAMKMARQYVIHRGSPSREPYDHEDRIVRPLPASFIRQIHRFPEERFLELSKCKDWRSPL